MQCDGIECIWRAPQAVRTPGLSTHCGILLHDISRQARAQNFSFILEGEGGQLTLRLNTIYIWF